MNFEICRSKIFQAILVIFNNCRQNPSGAIDATRLRRVCTGPDSGGLYRERRKRMGSCVNNSMMMMISTAPTSGKLSTKCPLLLVSSVTHHTCSFTFTHLLHNNPVTTATTTTLCGSLSAHSAISSIRGRRSTFNGKSKYICCNSLLTSDIAPTASAAYGILLLAGGLFACIYAYFFFLFYFQLSFNSESIRVFLCRGWKIIFVLCLLQIQGQEARGRFQEDLLVHFL